MPQPVADATLVVLRASCGGHVRHEGLVLWMGRRVDEDTFVLAAVTPPTRHHPQGVFLDEPAVGASSRAARAFGLALVAQVHSHPGNDTRHSDGDDELVVMPHEGMFSLIVSKYGDGHPHPSDGAGLHQRQDGRWCQITNPEAMIIVPTVIGVG